MHKISIDLKVDQPRQFESQVTSDQIALFIEWIVTLALHGHYDLVECDSVSAIPLFAELEDWAAALSGM